MRRTALVAVTAALLVTGLVGCSSETPGAATPGGTPTAEPGGDGLPSFPETDTTTGSSSTTDGSGAGTEGLAACDLLTSAELGDLGLPPAGEQRDVGPARGCQWQTSGSHTLTVGVLDDLGTGEVVADATPEPLTVGSHQAVRYTSGGTCGMSVAVTDSSRVDVLGTAGGDLARACDVADQAARLVEPKLP